MVGVVAAVQRERIRMVSRLSLESAEEGEQVLQGVRGTEETCAEKDAHRNARTTWGTGGGQRARRILSTDNKASADAVSLSSMSVSSFERNQVRTVSMRAK